LRGAFTKINSLNKQGLKSQIVCASAGNHAQGVAYSCHLLGIKGVIFMPVTTPKQKVKQVKFFGKEAVEIRLYGDTFDDAFREASLYCEANKATFVHPFDDEFVISGQATIGLEICEQVKAIDYLVLPIGGGGLAAGLVSVFKICSPQTKIIGVEPLGAPSMKESIENGERVLLDNIDTFVDGASVKRVGELNFLLTKDYFSEIVLVPEGKLCSTLMQLYNEEAMVVEPAGALSISALDFLKDKIQGKNVVCIVSGGNSDITRTEEIKEKSLLYEGLKHYFLIQFPQRPGALKDFVSKVLGENDDITFFQFSKRNNKESGPVVVGIEIQHKDDLESLKARMNDAHFKFQYINENMAMFNLIVG
jgi:threonine dehydratase